MAVPRRTATTLSVQVLRICVDVLPADGQLL
jgi:hypothetical protein